MIRKTRISVDHNNGPKTQLGQGVIFRAICLTRAKQCEKCRNFKVGQEEFCSHFLFSSVIHPYKPPVGQQSSGKSALHNLDPVLVITND